MHSITKHRKRRLKKHIRQAIFATAWGLLAGILMVAMLIGSAIQEQNKLEALAAAEVFPG